MLMSESLFILQQLLMETNAEMKLGLAEMRPLSKSSPTTSSESDKGVDCSLVRQPVAHKRRRRGRHRRKWKPYSSMTLEEKRAVEAREAARVAKREARLARKPSAPWNTTQFIMEDRGCKEVRIPTPRASRTLSLDDSLSEEDFYESPEDELFEHRSLMEQEFESTYQEVASERLQGLSKAELVEECMVLERELTTARDRGHEEVTKLELELNFTRNQGQEELTKLGKEVAELQNKVELLQRENGNLQRAQEHSR